MGSPPHTRGILVEINPSGAVRRFTPAYAGNTLENCKIETVAQVHPRIRGEYRISRVLRSLKMGSPPHTRGIPAAGAHTHAITRFTPAYAGNTNTG